MRKFKIWAYLEALDEKRGEYIDLVDAGLVEPVSLGEFPDFASAWKQIMNLPGYQSAPADLNVLINAESIARKIQARPCTDGLSEPETSGVTITLGRVDWRLLRRQKRSLAAVAHALRDHKRRTLQEDLDGVLNFLDFIQDRAAEQLGETLVFWKR